MNVNPFREAYCDLARKLLQVDELPPFPLGMSGSRWDYENNRPFPRPSEPPGRVDDKTEERIVIELCRLVPGLTAQYLAGRDEQQRLEWMKAAIAAQPGGKWVIQKLAAAHFKVSRMEMSRRVKNNEVKHNGEKGKASRVFIPDSETESPAPRT